MKFLATILAFAIIFPGLASIGHAQDSEIILRVAMQDDIKTTNPLVAGDEWTWDVLKWIYEGAILTDSETGDIIPYIAVGTAGAASDLSVVDWDDCTIGRFDYIPENEWNDSGKPEAVVFYDFTDVYWHDGEQMDVRDLMFSYYVAANANDPSMNCLMDKEYLDWRSWYDPGTLHISIAWESEDGLQVALKFNLTERYINFFKTTLSHFLLPYHIWGYTTSGQNIDGAKIWYDEGYDVDASDSWKLDLALGFSNTDPVGSGIFQFDHWERGQLIKIVTWRDHFFNENYAYKDFINENYPDALVKQPTIDAIVFKIYKTAEAAVLAMRNDYIDLMLWSIPPTFVPDLEWESDISIIEIPENDFFYMGYNMRRQSFGYNESAHFPYAPEDDFGKPLRRAIAHRIDKEHIKSRLLLDHGYVGTGPINPLSEFYNSSIPTYDFDPEQAIAILEEAGYILDDPSQPPGPDNYWNNPDGTGIGSGPGGGINILTPEVNYDPIRAQVGLMIAQQLQDIGINAYSVPMFFGSIVDRIDQRDLDMYILGWHISSEPEAFLHAFFHSSEIENQNYPGYQNESFDRIIDLAWQIDDTDVKLKAIKDAQAAIAYDLPYDVLYFRSNIIAYVSGNLFGWIIQNNNIFNRDSIINLRGPYENKLIATFVNPPSAVVSNSTNSITLKVTDQDRNPIAGIRLKLNTTRGALNMEEVTTNAFGNIDLTFTAPYVPPTQYNIENGSMVLVQIFESTTIDEDGNEYQPAPMRSIAITVYPEDVKFLSVKMSADPDVIDPDSARSGDAITQGFTRIVVEVADENGDPAVGAAVGVSVSPTVPELHPAETITDADGKAEFSLTSVDEPNDDNSLVHYTVTAHATIPHDPDMRPGENSIEIVVVDRNMTSTPLPPPGFDQQWPEMAFLAGSGIIVALAVYMALRRRDS